MNFDDLNGGNFEFDLPNPEDMRPIDKRPPCPYCGEDMIHAEIRGSGDNHIHAWMCDCEPQRDKEMEDMIRTIRKEGNLSTAMVIQDRIEPPSNNLMTALKTAVDALDYIAGMEEPALASMYKERAIASMALKKVKEILGK